MNYMNKAGIFYEICKCKNIKIDKYFFIQFNVDKSNGDQKLG